MTPFAYHTPATLEETLALLHEHGEGAKLHAGGTALVIMMKQRLVAPDVLINLQRLQGLAVVTEEPGMLRLGALLTHRAAEAVPLICARMPVLAETYRHVATVGGSLAHADPNQDPPVTLLALDARVRLASASGSREVPLNEFFTDYYTTVLRPDEMLTAVDVPIPRSHTGSVYLKFLPRTADDYATVGVAATIELDESTGNCRECRIALGSVGVTPLRAAPAEALVRGQQLSPELLRAVAEAAQQQTDPISDSRGSAAYKRAMTGVFVQRALEQAWKQAQATLYQ